MPLLLGALAWFVGIGSKRVLYATSGRRVLKLVLAQAGLRGTISAVSELGVWAAFFVLLPIRSLVGIYMFGLGAAIAEFAVLLSLRYRLRKGADVSQEPLLWRAQFATERCCAAAVHVGSRCLLYLAISHSNVTAGAIGFVSFTLVDGVAAFGKLRYWSWTAPRIAYSYYAFVGAIGIADIVIFQLSYRAGRPG